MSRAPFFIGVGLLIIALSGDLPTGSLSLPGSGFLPKIVAVLTIFFGLVLDLAREREQTLRDCAMARRKARCPGRRDYRDGRRAL